MWFQPLRYGEEDRKEKMVLSFQQTILYIMLKSNFYKEMMVILEGRIVSELICVFNVLTWQNKKLTSVVDTRAV